MRLSYIFPFLLALFAFCAYASDIHRTGSNITYVGSPRHMLDAIQPMMEIEEQYIQAQTDEIFKVGLATIGYHQCSAAEPCLDGSCCNTKGKSYLPPILFDSHS